MYNIDRTLLQQKAVQTGFVRDNLEKVYRLTELLAFINAHPTLSRFLALKGGTAINLTVFHMPRLSVDIDLDFHMKCSRDTMLEIRQNITHVLLRYMQEQSYTLHSNRANNSHSLDSWVFYYHNAGGNQDNIKVEINYSMRDHILLPQRKAVNIEFLQPQFMVYSLATLELFGSKIKALLERAAPRDLYDIYNMIQGEVFEQVDWEMLRRCILFYKAVGSTGDFVKQIQWAGVRNITERDVRQTLLPVLRKHDSVSLENMKAVVSSFLSELLVLSTNEKLFLQEFSIGNYKPELLFQDKDILDRIENHPMAQWKCMSIRKAKLNA